LWPISKHCCYIHLEVEREFYAGQVPARGSEVRGLYPGALWINLTWWEEREWMFERRISVRVKCVTSELTARGCNVQIVVLIMVKWLSGIEVL
jgi:hypothetical protein